MSDRITFDDCCRFILEQGAQHESYRRSLIALLNKEFDIDWNDDENLRWCEGLPAIASTMPGKYPRALNPFADWIEYTPVKGEERIWRKHKDTISAAERAMQQCWIVLFRDLLLLRWPDAAKRTTSWARLRALGLVVPEYDPDGF